MFNIKRIGVVVAAAALLVTLTACGTKDDTNTTTEPAPTTQTAEPTKKPSPNDEYAWVNDVEPLLAELGWEIDPDHTQMGCSISQSGDSEWNRVCVPMLKFGDDTELQPMRFKGDGEAMQMRFADFKGNLLDPINPRANDGIVPPSFAK